MLVSELKLLQILDKGPPEGMSNKTISNTIVRESDEKENLGSIKVLVSRKMKELVSRNEVEHIGRHFRITGRGQTRLNAGSHARTTYDLKKRVYPNMTVSIAVSPTSGKIIYEDREVIEALEQLNKAEEGFSIIIKDNKKRDGSE